MSSRPESIASQQTVPSKAMQNNAPASYPSVAPIASPAIPSPSPADARRRSAKKPTPKKKSVNWVLIIGGGLMIGLLAAGAVMFIGLTLIYTSNDIIPGTQAFGLDVGSMSVEEAAVEIESQAGSNMILRDGDREWSVDSTLLGVRIDGAATAQNAYDDGRSNMLQTLFVGSSVEPVLDIDLAQMQSGLEELAPQIEQPAINAGVQLVNGQVQATPAQTGRVLDISATIALVQQDATDVLRDGTLELVMMDVQPTVLDASPMVAQANQLLSNPLNIQGFDPVVNERLNWSLTPQEWGQWLIAEPDPTSSTGLRLTVNSVALTQYLSEKENGLGAPRYLNVEEAVNDIQAALAINNLNVQIRIYHSATQHTVRSGESLSSIAYDYGIPYGWIQAENPGISTLSVGQTITVPSPDELIPLPIVYNKRIIISIPQQRMWAYENDQLKWEWVVSTGISSSPTAPGVFQIQTHFDNAYAGNWDLWMPYFMGIYQPVPNIDFMNGFHGFPTRGGSQLLWTNSLGTRVTYGCILLSNTNAQLLYDWAEEGVIVEIQG